MTPKPTYHGDRADGPLSMLWGIGEWVEPTHPERMPECATFPRGRLHRMLGERPFCYMIRLEPHGDLTAFGERMTALLRTPPIKHPPVAGDRALFMFGGVWAQRADLALRHVEDVLARRAPEVHLLSLSIRVWSAR